MALYADSMDATPFPRLFLLDFLKEEEKAVFAKDEEDYAKETMVRDLYKEIISHLKIIRTIFSTIYFILHVGQLRTNWNLSLNVTRNCRYEYY